MSNNDNPIRVLIIDDHDLVHSGIKESVEGFWDIQIIDCVLDGKDVVAKVKSSRPDVIFLDINMPDFDFEQTLDELRELKNELTFHLIIISGTYDAYLACEAESLGIDGYLLKEDRLSDIVPRAIRSVGSGTFIGSQKVLEARTAWAAHRSTTADVSKDDKRILLLLSRGWKQARVAEEMGLTERAVNQRVYRLKQRWDIDTVHGLVVFAIKNDIINLE